MILGRIAQGIRNQDWFTAVLELAILVIGIYIGLQVDDWVTERENRETETMYLEFLARDVTELQEQVAAQFAFEQDKVEAAAEAFQMLQQEDPAQHRQELGLLLSSLSSRRTLSLDSSTYEQMVSSGHLQLIQDRELRDRVVRQFTMMKRDQQIISKNNQDLVDDLYGPFLLQIGISFRFGRASTEDPLNRSSLILADKLGSDFDVEDTVLTLSPEAESWNEIRRHVVHRMRVAAVGQAKAEDIAAYLEALEKDLAAALAAR